MNPLSSVFAVLIAIGFVTLAPGADAATPVSVWWEGESPTETNFPRQTWLSGEELGQTRDRLSGSDWLTNEGERGDEEAYARYEIEVPIQGTYHFWARKFWRHGPFRWRFGEGEWRIAGRNLALADDTYLKTHVGANWVYLGDVTLAPGATTFELRLLAGPGESLTSGFDAFLLIDGPFMPRGKLKPGEMSGLADPGYFPFEPDLDPFGDDALLDLRGLNESEAGAHGFVRRDGARFVLGDGTPVRFWGVNVSANVAGQDRRSVDYLARRLAKLGVNAVRYHSPLFAQSGDPSRIDPQKLDDLHYLVAAMKRQGIYTWLSFYFPLWLNVGPETGIPGYDTIENKRPFTLLYFDERMQAIHRAWARQILTAQNPYTERPLAEEPALAVVEIVNEDSFFFWTFSHRNVPDVHWKRLEGLFGDWLRTRYGSVEEALARWGGATHPDDDAIAGRAGLFEAWHMTRAGIEAGGPDKRRRIGDQVRFLVDLQRGFYADTVRYLKDELGYRGLVSPSNWQVADGPMLDALERYTYTAGDVIDRHGYFGGKHEGEGASYSVRVGHRFESAAAVRHPENLPFHVFQIEAYPHTVSEIGWPQPNRYRSDMTFLSAAYGALQGIDGFFFFTVASNFLLDTSMSKFGIGTPAVIGTFPATALLYRRGDVSEAEDAIRQVLRLEDLYAMKGSGSATPEALDALRQADVPARAAVAGPIDRYDPLSYEVGRVVRSFGDDPDASSQRDLARYIDRKGKVVRSLTGQLGWNWKRGVVTIDTPRAQGAAGFLRDRGPFRLSRISIETENEFLSVIVISLDARPIPSSKTILIQAATEDQPYGFRSDGDTILDLGSFPFGMKRIAATVSLKLDAGEMPKVVALDPNGYATDTRVGIENDGDTLRVRLPDRAIYTILRR